MKKALRDLQDWILANKKSLSIVFEGRDAAGKDDTIKAITEPVSPRIFQLPLASTTRTRNVVDRLWQC